MSNSMVPRWATVVVACSVFAAGCTTNQHQPSDPRSELLVNADWLVEHIGDPDLVILHVGDSAGYAVQLYDGSFRDWATRDLPVVVDSVANGG